MPPAKRNIKKKETARRPRVGVALGGGSARGIAHIGVLKAFIDYGIPVDCISGTSAGAVAAAMYAFDIPFDTLIEKAKKLSWYSVSGVPLFRLGLVSNSALKKAIEGFIGPVDIAT
jgi:NTE family protein